MYRRRFWQLSASAGNCTKKMDQTEFLSNDREQRAVRAKTMHSSSLWALKNIYKKKKSSTREQQQRKNGEKKYFLFKNRIYSETFNDYFFSLKRK